MKLFAALGPGDIVAVHRAHMSGQSWFSETSFTYSGQLVEYCREQNIEMLGVSHHARIDSVCDGLVTLENRPRKFEGQGGIRFHLSMIARAFYLVGRAWRAGADLAIIDSSSTHCFALFVFALFRIPVAIDLHNTLWPMGSKPKGLVPWGIERLDAWFFRRIAAGAVGVSPECGRQVRELVACNFPFFEYRSQFRSSGFQFGRNEHGHRPFGVMFAGRAERNKGILDIPDIAEKVHAKSSASVLFEVCGDGSALEELRRIVHERKLHDLVRVHGNLTRPDLLGVYRRAHVVIVPTRSDFSEGFAKVCAEAVLAGRPIIASPVVPALEVVRNACLEARADDIDSYVEAVLRLVDDRDTYEQLSDACPGLARLFLDRSYAYPAAIDRLIGSIFPNWNTLESYEGLFTRIA